MLVLEDGRHAEIVAADEELLDVRGRDAVHLAGLAWHIGNRHLAAAIEAERILILRDHVIKAMLEGLGAAVTEVVEPFNPLGGAYSGEGGHGHGHDAHGHTHDHGITRPRPWPSPFARRMTHHRDDPPSESTGMTGDALTSGWPDQAADLAVAGLSGRQLQLQPWAGIGGRCRARHGRGRPAGMARRADRLRLGLERRGAVRRGVAARVERRATSASLAELGEALAGSRERHSETMLQGAAFRVAAMNGWPHRILERCPPTVPMPSRSARRPARTACRSKPALAVFLHAFVANLAQAAIRLGVTGQNGAVSVIAALERDLVDTAGRAASSTLDDLGSAAIVSEIMSMKHETHYSRLFRS